MKGNDKMKRYLAYLLCFMLVISLAFVVSGCENNDNADETAIDSKEEAPESSSNTDDTTESEALPEETEEKTPSVDRNSAFPTKLTAAKLHSTTRDIVACQKNSYTYKSGDTTPMYGIASYDGSYDSGAIYTQVYARNVFFEIENKVHETDYEKVETLNCKGIADQNGKVLLPAEYISVSVLNEHYVSAYKATAKTDSEADAVITLYNYTPPYTPDDITYLYYIGTWHLYDVSSGTAIEIATGKKETDLRAYGEVISYRTDDGNYIYQGPDRNPIEGDFHITQNGIIIRGSKQYNYKNELLFEVEEGFMLIEVAGNHDRFVISKSEKGKSVYKVINGKGETISAEFPDSISVYNDLIVCGEKVYDFDGKQILDGEYSSVFNKKVGGVSCYILENGDSVAFLDGELNVLFEGEIKDNTESSEKYNLIYKKATDDTTYFLYYCYNKKDYVQGSKGIGFLMVMNKDDEVIDLLSGEVLLEGYADYSSETYDGKLFLLAKKNNITDIYLVTAE